MNLSLHGRHLPSIPSRPSSSSGSTAERSDEGTIESPRALRRGAPALMDSKNVEKNAVVESKTVDMDAVVDEFGAHKVARKWARSSRQPQQTVEEHNLLRDIAQLQKNNKWHENELWLHTEELNKHWPNPGFPMDTHNSPYVRLGFHSYR